MKRIAYAVSTFVSMFALVLATTDSAAFVNKPQAPKELLKK